MFLLKNKPIWFSFLDDSFYFIFSLKTIIWSNLPIFGAFNYPFKLSISLYFSNIQVFKISWSVAIVIVPLGFMIEDCFYKFILY